MESMTKNSKHIPHGQVTVAEDHAQMVLDGTKIGWHTDRLEAWERGERIAPITVDMALTRACDAACWFCFAQIQESERKNITKDVITSFLEDSAEMGVRAVSLVSDGESLLSPVYAHTITHGKSLGISMASGTNGHLFTHDKLEAVLPCLDYIRFNVSGGNEERYCQIMGVKPEFYRRVMVNICDALAIKKRDKLPVTIGIQMVFEPRDKDQLMPFAQLGVDLGVDYAVIKHCSDDEYGSLGVAYGKYPETYELLKQAESLSTAQTKVIVKWNKIITGNKRSYQRCYGPPFIIQVSGSGLVAPCGMLFNDRYAKFHIGNITEQRWMDIWKSDRYWEVMRYLGSDQFNAQKHCGALCLQDMTNRALDNHVKGKEKIEPATGKRPLHVNFV